MADEEKLRERVLKKFVERKAYSPQFVLELAEKFADMATITTAGNVVIKCKCSVKDRVAIVAIARFLGNLLKDEIKSNIPAEVTSKEVAKYAGIDKFMAAARLKDLTDGGLLDKPSRGVFKVRSPSHAENWIDSLHEKYFKKKGD